MKELNFKKWLTEASSSQSSSTTTSSIAQFKMPIGTSLVRRNWPFLRSKNKH